MGISDNESSDGDFIQRTPTKKKKVVKRNSIIRTPQRKVKVREPVGASRYSRMQNIGNPGGAINEAALYPEKTSDGCNKLILPHTKHIWYDPNMQAYHGSIVIQLTSGATKHSISAQMNGPRLCEVVIKYSPMLTNPDMFNNIVYRGKYSSGHVKTVGFINAGNELMGHEARKTIADGKMQIDIPFEAEEQFYDGLGYEGRRFVKLEDQQGNVYSFLFLEVIAVRTNKKDLVQEVDCEFYSMRSNESRGGDDGRFSGGGGGGGGGGGRNRNRGADAFGKRKKSDERRDSSGRGRFEEEEPMDTTTEAGSCHSSAYSPHFDNFYASPSKSPFKAPGIRLSDEAIAFATMTGQRLTGNIIPEQKTYYEQFATFLKSKENNKHVNHSSSASVPGGERRR